MKDFQSFLKSVDIDKMEFDIVNDIRGDISDLFEYIPKEGAAALIRIMHATVKTYLRAYHQFLLEQFDE